MAVSSGSASDEAARKANDMQSQGMALQLAKLASEIEVNKSIANSNNANADTTNESRSIMIENARQAGIAQYLENISNEWKVYRDWETDRKSTRLNSSHSAKSRMPSSA